MDPRSRGDDRPSALRLTPQRGGAAKVTVRPVNGTADDPIYEWKASIARPSLLSAEWGKPLTKLVVR